MFGLRAFGSIRTRCLAARAAALKEVAKVRIFMREGVVNA